MATPAVPSVDTGKDVTLLFQQMANRDASTVLFRVRAFALAGLAGFLFALAWACGGGGPSVPACRAGTPTDTVTPISAAGLTLKVGSYEGTGSPQCIRGVGFEPVVVIVKGDTGEYTVWRSGSMDGDSTADFASGQANIEDAITSLDPDAFSLGEDPSVNAEGIPYQYIAFANSPDIRVGSYAGDGANERAITGVGFEPALVFVKWDGARSAVWRSAAHPDSVSSMFDGKEDPANFINSFEADGFEVGSDAWVNQDGGPDLPTTYHFVAFRDVPGRLKAGSYVGDGSDDRDITEVGIQPDYVWIKRSSAGSKGVHRPSSLTGDATLHFENTGNGSGEIKALLPNGFSVGKEASVNSDGDTYRYAAWKANGS